MHPSIFAFNNDKQAIRRQLTAVRQSLLCFLGTQRGQACEVNLVYCYPHDASGLLERLDRAMGSLFTPSLFYALCYGDIECLDSNNVELLLESLKQIKNRRYASSIFSIKRIAGLNEALGRAIAELDAIYTAIYELEDRINETIEINIFDLLSQLEIQIGDYVAGNSSFLLATVQSKLQELALQFNDFDDYDEQKIAPIKTPEKRKELVDELNKLIELLKKTLELTQDDEQFVMLVGQIIVTLNFITTGIIFAAEVPAVDTDKENVLVTGSSVIKNSPKFM